MNCYPLTHPTNPETVRSWVEAEPRNQELCLGFAYQCQEFNCLSATYYLLVFALAGSWDQEPDLGLKPKL